jgi:hypothetical protein
MATEIEKRNGRAADYLHRKARQAIVEIEQKRQRRATVWAWVCFGALMLFIAICAYMVTYTP